MTSGQKGNQRPQLNTLGLKLIQFKSHSHRRCSILSRMVLHYYPFFNTSKGGKFLKSDAASVGEYNRVI